jgi:hypothetical protein
MVSTGMVCCIPQIAGMGQPKNCPDLWQQLLAWLNRVRARTQRMLIVCLYSRGSSRALESPGVPNDIQFSEAAVLSTG